MADLCGGHLVDRDPGADVGAVGLERVGPGQEAGQRSCVVAPLVAHRRSVLLRQSAQHQQVLAERLERAECRWQAESRAGLRGRPVGHVDAVGDVEERDPPGDLRAGAASPARAAAGPSPRARAGPWPSPSRAGRRDAITGPVACSQRVLLFPPRFNSGASGTDRSRRSPARAPRTGNPLPRGP